MNQIFKSKINNNLNSLKMKKEENQ